MSSAVEAFMHEVESRNVGEREFLQAVGEVVESVMPILDKRPDLRKARILERIVEPERVVMFRVPWVDDRGEVQVNRGFRVQMNSAIGPYKGGLRFHASVKLSVIKFLAFEQTFKNALTTLPMGGGKGGSDFSPKGKSDNEIMRFCQAFMSELFRHVGPDTDVPAGDVGVGGREIGYMFGQYKKLANRFEGWITGKGLNWGGSLIRKEAAGFGTVYFAQEMLATKGDSLAGKTVCISGYGNLGSHALEKLNELGAKVVTIADEEHYIYEPDGIKGEKAKYVIDLWQVHRQSLDAYANKYGVQLHPGRPWKVPCDVAIPTGAENEIKLEDAKALVANGCKCVAEGANMPSTAEAVQHFQEHGVLFGPGKAANAGGVATSGLEMSQNSMRIAWSREEVDSKLKEIMKRIHKACLDTAAAYGSPGNYVDGANIAGFLKVADAMMDQGVV
ncbi:MAG: NADP-specific glutamate dehydrogenase [Phycisphaerales bacterium]|nr:NADP-specific glutamate dehydrogenase [Phycisphaerales bacterium]